MGKFMTQQFMSSDQQVHFCEYNNVVIWYVCASFHHNCIVVFIVLWCVVIVFMWQQLCITCLTSYYILHSRDTAAGECGQPMYCIYLLLISSCVLFR